MLSFRQSTAVAVLVFVIAAPGGLAQDAASPLAPALLDTCDWRLVGPFRGGRSSAVAGVLGDRQTYYMGTAGGGVWKTTDAGATWNCVSDGFFGGSIGAVAVADSDPRIVWAGTGESTWRGNVSSGDGLWQSTDAGATWTHKGLADSRHCSRIRIDPRDPQRVFVAAMGHCSGPNDERGVYRSLDGGTTWERVLFASDQAGAVDLCFEPGNARTLYASTWRAARLPHTFSSGGEGSALWQSTDGGTTWRELSQNAGFAKAPLGIIGVSVSPAEPKCVYAQVEAAEGGLFRSDDRGATWKRVNEDRELRQRAWYYTRLEADPKHKDTVWVLNVALHKSTDGGKTFARVRSPHADHHDLWIDPEDPQRLALGNDGGGCVSTDGGASWSSQQNQPTAQFYRVTTDDGAPWRIYGAQQDSSTVRIRHRSNGAGIARTDWEATAGGESGWLAPVPGDPEVVFGGSYGGYLEMQDHRRGLSRRVDVWPDNPMGAGAEAMRWRFQWNFPLLFSPHQPERLYAAGNVLFESRDRGQTWTPISPDLTRNDASKLGSSGGPITQDNTSVEYYCTIFSVAESKRRQGVLWCGSDDGLVHVSRDGGANWTNVTPKGLPEWAQINCIEADLHRDGGCWVAATRYKLDDFAPYVFVTEDYGASWRTVTTGLDARWFVRAVRVDPVHDRIAYVGTERGVWMTLDGGAQWQPLQRNLPITPVTDLCVHDDVLVAATQGRSFWAFDHLAHLRQLAKAPAARPVTLFAPVPFVLHQGGDEVVPGEGRNPSKAPLVRVLCSEVPAAEVVCRLEVLDGEGKVLWSRDSKAEKDDERLQLRAGMNALRWEWKPEDAKGFDGMVLWAGGLSGPSQPAPGEYRVRLSIGDDVQEAPLSVRSDARSPASKEDLQRRFQFVVECRDTITKAHEAVLAVRSLKSQLDTVVGRAKDEAKAELERLRDAVVAEVEAVEGTLYQTKSKSRQDPLNYPIRLTDKLAGVMGDVNGAPFGPTAAQVGVKEQLCAAIAVELQKLEQAKANGIAAFNAAARRLEIPHVQ